MATSSVGISKSSKWFFNKSFKLSLPGRQQKSDTLSPSTPSPRSPARPSLREGEIQSPVLTLAVPSSTKGKLEEVFRHFDSDGDGKISCLELREYFCSIGENISVDEAQGVINDLDMNGDGLLDFHEFKQLMDRETKDDDIRQAFEMFEAEKGSGCITPKSLQRMLNRLGDEKSHEECEAMIRAYDLDENGLLDFHEFHQMMT